MWETEISQTTERSYHFEDYRNRFTCRIELLVSFLNVSHNAHRAFGRNLIPRLIPCRFVSCTFLAQRIRIHAENYF